MGHVRKLIQGGPLLGLLFLTTVAGTGCVRRELTVTSEPPGALVFLNDQEVGRTPLTRQFTFYGTYDVRLRKEGYRTLKAQSLVLAPWWQWVPFDLAAELFPLTDRQTKNFILEVDPESEVAGSTTRPSGPAESADAMLLRALSLKARLSPLSTTEPAAAPAAKPASTSAPTAPAPVQSQPAPEVAPAQPPAPLPPANPPTPPVQPGIIEVPNPK